MAVYNHASWAWLRLYKAHASEHVHGDSKWRPTMNLATECAEKLAALAVAALTKQ